MAQKQVADDHNDDETYIFCKEYTNRWGKLMRASDYGHMFWRLKIKHRRKS